MFFFSFVKFVPTLSLSASPTEYYDWEDAMKDFFWDCGLESLMKIFFAKRTFSKQVLKWWINLQQQHIASGDEPCQTWNGMKLCCNAVLIIHMNTLSQKLIRLLWLLRNILTKSIVR
jgi:hypothetical protein